MESAAPSVLSGVMEEEIVRVTLIWDREECGEEIEVAPLGEDLYRVTTPPLFSLPLRLHDVFEATEDADGLHYVRRVARGLLLRDSWSVQRQVAETAELAALLDEIRAAGGYAERIFGGLLFTYLPRASTLDIGDRLNELHDRFTSLEHGS